MKFMFELNMRRRLLNFAKIAAQRKAPNPTKATDRYEQRHRKASLPFETNHPCLKHFATSVWRRHAK